MSYSTKTSMVSAVPEWLVCNSASCSQTSPTHMCSTCRRSYYCSENCQKHDWPSHKLKCVSYEERLSKLEKPPLALATKDDVCVDCKRPAKAPLFLPCGHVVCLGCMISSDQINDRNACPECKSIYVTSEGYFGLFPHGLLPHLHLMKQFTETETSAARILNDPHVIDKEAHYDALEAVDQAIASSKSLAVFIENDLQRGVIEAWKIPLRRLHQMCRILQGHFLYLNGKPQDCIDASLKALSEVDEYLKDHYRALPEARAILERLEKDGIEALYDAMSALSGNAGNSPNMLNLLVLRAYFVLGKAHEALQKPTDALEWYSRIPSKAQPNESQCAAEGLMARSQLKLQLGNTVASLKLAKEALLVDNSVPGVHKNLAGQLQDAGDLMAAKKTMNQALYYEAPWDKANKMVNKSFIAGIYEEERRIEERRIREVRFLEIWGELIDAAWTSKQTGQFISWETVKLKRFDMYAKLDKEDEARQRMISKLRAAAVDAAIESRDEESESLQQISLLSADMIGDSLGMPTKRLDEVEKLDFDRFKLTLEVTKWLQGAGRGNDAKLRKIFQQRMRQLAAGDKSRILQKKLVGSKNMTIYETYMDGNFRILWTKDSDLGMVIWFVSPHDNVSRNMEKIVEAVARSSRQMITTSASSLAEFAADADLDDLAPSNVLLDPDADTPLKLFLVRYDDISRLDSSWQPPLYLTTEERLIVEKEGTVLLLGRSGTGKTVCICNRIDFDRHLAENDPTFTALFVARSKRICNYVQRSVGLLTDDVRDSAITFWKFDELLDSCEARLFAFRQYEPEKNVSFQQFKEVFGQFDCGDLDALVVWTSIKSFIKGSIEAVVQGTALSREDYLSTEKIGSRRCRLSTEQRGKVYDIFEKYQSYMSRENMGRWDDCDRIFRIVSSLRADWVARQELSRRRIYVDEIQDYTQAEIALFFLVCDRGGIFLAGDPAQSVVEGVEFRFEEVRSVAWNLFDEADRAKYVPSKPLTVNRNFRSHKGILNVAGEILDRLFEAFPGSAKELPNDEGLFMGPRPSILQDVKPQMLKELVEKIDGVVLLTMSDVRVKELEKIVPKNVVLSIRDSKGLEFADVIIVDFFKDLAPEHQKPWKQLIQGRVEDGMRNGFPELETHLKQLYTAVTRCTNHLFFAETGKSDAGQAFFRRLTDQLKLATRQAVNDVEKMEKSSDEWRTVGVKYATYAESESDPTYWMTKAIVCFKQSDDLSLVAKAELHLESIRFRACGDSEFGLDGEAFDIQVSKLLLRLVEEGLTLEARRVYHRVLPLLDDYTKESLEKRLAVNLPLLEDYD